MSVLERHSIQYVPSPVNTFPKMAHKTMDMWKGGKNMCCLFYNNRKLFMRTFSVPNCNFFEHLYCASKIGHLMGQIDNWEKQSPQRQICALGKVKLNAGVFRKIVEHKVYYKYSLGFLSLSV